MNRTFWIRMDPCWFSLADVYAYEGGKFLWFLTWFCSEIQSWTFRLLRCWFCCWFWGWNPEINCDPSFFFLTGSEPLNSSFFLLLNLPLWSVLEFLASGEEFAPWIAEFIAQWWRFNWISESSHENSIDFGSSLLLKRLGFCELFLMNFCFDLNCQERECGLC